MKKETLKCPKCGHDQFGMVRQCRGNWYQGVKFIGATYEVEDGQNNTYLVGMPKKIQCERCGAKIPNPAF